MSWIKFGTYTGSPGSWGQVIPVPDLGEGWSIFVGPHGPTLTHVCRRHGELFIDGQKSQCVGSAGCVVTKDA